MSEASLMKAFVWAWVLVLASACGDGPESPPAQPAAQPAPTEASRAREHKLFVPVPEATSEEDLSPSGERPEPEDPSPSAAQLPVPEDFHAEAAASIAAGNYLGELDKLEAELRADE